MSNFGATLASAGYTVVLASNQPREFVPMVELKLAATSFPGQRFYSCEIGIQKPLTEYYTYVLSELRISPSEALFFDDSTANILAAEEIGIRCINVRNHMAAINRASHFLGVANSTTFPPVNSPFQDL